MNGILKHESLGSMVRIMREAFDMTLRQLAVKIGASFGYISQIESNKISRPSDSIILKLSRALSLNPDILFSSVGEVTPEIRKMIAKHPEELTTLIRLESKKLDSVDAR